MTRGDISRQLSLGDAAANKICELGRSLNILDVGGGDGRHSLFFYDNGHNVTFNDFTVPESICNKKINTKAGNFLDIDFDESYSVVFCSHVFEHQLNPHNFLLKAKSLLNDNGYLALVVPPAKSQIVSGHYSVWFSGLVLYHLVMAGFDCSMARVLESGYNISVIVRKKEIELPELRYDYGDLENLKEFFPKSLEWSGDSFNGIIQDLNWFEW